MFQSQPDETVLEDIAVAASLAMALEASSYPKPGNVHRLKDFKNTNYEHFLASAIATEFVFWKAAAGKSKIGELLFEAVAKSERRQAGGNTHFGTFLLILPLAAAAGSLTQPNDCGKTQPDANLICRTAAQICRQTDEEDAYFFYLAFEKLNVPAKKDIDDGADFDLSDPNAKERIKTQKVGLFGLMESAIERDMIAKEWVTGFELTRRFSDRLLENNAYFVKNPDKQFKNALNSAIVLTFLEFMADYSDTFIETKLDEKTAADVRKMAKDILDSKKGTEPDLNRLIPKMNELDNELHARKANPGSLADIAAAGIFLALLGGLTF
ncbi:2-(5''-triphosphoribosyl)-3'-dephosphocoenzyme-A synthase [Methanosarcinaceae archaeon Ag5]|uniref:2-(5''-triphosphoribosyl)-3'-dephosphocoenzyme-A synthase n=1 Tax=Methanolapillus africanus TaxID=3028297 RepID=A0AAE4MI10_9EURY|nr:2-(5''-triphosphoribosyl)-3'-dephosphocoenzyme-A synthase [Methanosarcinaceae archaeon Ag5]